MTLTFIVAIWCVVSLPIGVAIGLAIREADRRS